MAENPYTLPNTVFADTVQRPPEQQSRLSNGFNPIDWGQALVRAGAEDTLNVFGIDKSPQTIQFEKDNPLASLAASFVGGGIPYVGWYKASKRIKQFDSLLEGISAARATGPIVQGTIREAARFAPLEAARFMSTAVNNPDRLPEIAGSAALDTALGGAFGALGGIGESYGSVAKQIKDLAPNVNLRDPWTLQLRTLRDALLGGQIAPERAAEAQTWINRMSKVVLTEQLPEDRKYITSVYNDTGAGGAQATEKANWLNNFFKPRQHKNLAVRMLTVADEKSPLGYNSQEAVDSRLASLPDGATAYMQFPRVLEVRAAGEGGVEYLHGRISQNMTQIAKDTYLTREGDSGLFVMMKKIKTGGSREAVPLQFPRSQTGSTDEYLVFKTDNPGFFVKRAQAWQDRQIAKSAWYDQGAMQNIQYADNTSGKFIQNTMEQMTLRNFYDDLSKAKTDEEFTSRMLGKVGLKPSEKLSDAARGIYSFMKEYFSPLQFQFSGPGGTIARYVLGVTKPTYDRANWVAEDMVYGKPISPQGRNLVVSNFFQGARDRHGDALMPLIERLDGKDRQKLLEVMGGGWSSEVINNAHIKGDISDNLKSLLSRLDSQDTAQMTELMQAQMNAGLTKSVPLKGHLMLSRMWDGDIRLRIRGEKGETVYMVGSKSRGQAIADADAIIKTAGQEGKWTYDKSAQWTPDLFLRGTDSGKNDLAELAGIDFGSVSYRKAAAAMEKRIRDVYRPTTLKERLGVEGYSMDMSDKAIAGRIFKHAQQIQTHIADINISNLLQREAMMLADQNPGMHRQVMERIGMMRGQAGIGSEMQNAIVDRVLGPYLGKNSATKIVGALNTTQHNLQLGMGNIMYPIVNMMQFVQTVLPHVAFVATADARSLAEHYNSLIVPGADGFARGTVHWLDPIKLTYKGFRIMSSPSGADRGLFNRAVEEGIFAPKLVEEHIGVNAQFKQRLGSLLQEKGGFVKFIQYLSEWLPNKSEQFSRLHSFTTGVAVGRDLMKLNGDQLYNFAKEFTHNTMFGYNMVDRAKAITGPVGSFLGLYKNWQMHYLGWFLQYAGEASKGNFAPLLWSNAGTMALAGVGGTAFYGMADALSRGLTNRSAFQNTYSMFSLDPNGHPDTLSDAMFYGLPSFLNVSLQGSTAAPGSNPMKDASQLFSFVQLERANAIGKAVGNAFSVADATGGSPFADPVVRDTLLRALSPRSIMRSAQVLEGDFLKSLHTGNPVVKGLGPVERFSYALGFNSPEIDRAYRVSDELFADEEKRLNAVRSFARQLNVLQDSKDWTGVSRLQRVVVASGVGLDSVIRSAVYQKERAQQGMVAYRAGKKAPPAIAKQFEDAP
jgi:hypothetical protein